MCSVTRVVQPGGALESHPGLRDRLLQLLAANRSHGVFWLPVCVGVIVRAYHILRHDFPLNDGGLFYAMARDLQTNDYAIPRYTSYNASDIPFAYPPFAMYLAALIDDLTPVPLIDAFRLLPLLGTSLSLVGFALLARLVLPNQTCAALAT